MNGPAIALLRELTDWDAADAEERRECALAVAEALPQAFAFGGLETHALGDASHEIARFSCGGDDFVLLPGSSAASLGYDRARPYRASDAQLADWRIVQEELDCSLDDFLDQCLSPLRRVVIPPLLVEAVARAFPYSQDGDDQAEGYDRARAFCGGGFRLPTVDEWEYACAAGSRSLFRWGDDCPLSSSADEQRFTRHREPNAFGLRMGSSTYDCELCEGPAIRGGDGGGAVCGGIGNLITWLPLASSFRVAEEEVKSWWIDEVLVRRVRPVVEPVSGSWR